jgi:hypothetical protein
MTDYENSAVTAPARLAAYHEKERRRQQLLEQQEKLARRERQESQQLHRTRNALDTIADKLDRVGAEVALAHELEAMRLCPQRPPVAFGGWTAQELTVLREVYSMTLAARVTEAAKLIGKPIDADMPEPTDPRVKAIMAAAEKARNLGR